jgi:hypothetical protein
MKTKHCPKCNLDLPREAFTSTRAKYCISCKRIRQLEQQRAMQQRAIERVKNRKQKKKTVVRKSELKKSVQRVFNKFIKLRDGNRCISCQRISDKVDAGHYIAQGSSGALRYDENNVHSQCRSCNRFKHANLIEYRINLVRKIGLERVEWLEAHRTDTKQWTREELNNLLSNYKKMVEELER